MVPLSLNHGLQHASLCHHMLTHGSSKSDLASPRYCTSIHTHIAYALFSHSHLPKGQSKPGPLSLCRGISLKSCALFHLSLLSLCLPLFISSLPDISLSLSYSLSLRSLSHPQTTSSLSFSVFSLLSLLPFQFISSFHSLSPQPPVFLFSLLSPLYPLPHSAFLILLSFAYLSFSSLSLSHFYSHSLFLCVSHCLPSFSYLSPP